MFRLNESVIMIVTVEESRPSSNRDGGISDLVLFLSKGKTFLRDGSLFPFSYTKQWRPDFNNIKRFSLLEMVMLQYSSRGVVYDNKRQKKKKKTTRRAGRSKRRTEENHYH